MILYLVGVGAGVSALISAAAFAASVEADSKTESLVSGSEIPFSFRAS